MCLISTQIVYFSYYLYKIILKHLKSISNICQKIVQCLDKFILRNACVKIRKFRKKESESS